MSCCLHICSSSPDVDPQTPTPTSQSDPPTSTFDYRYYPTEVFLASRILLAPPLSGTLPSLLHVLHHLSAFKHEPFHKLCPAWRLQSGQKAAARMIGTQRSCSRLLLLPGHLSGHVGVRSRNKWSGKYTAHVGLFKEADLAEREMCRGKDIKGSYECRKSMFV